MNIMASEYRIKVGSTEHKVADLVLVGHGTTVLIQRLDAEKLNLDLNELGQRRLHDERGSATDARELQADIP